jgi:hypothetical protein
MTFRHVAQTEEIKMREVFWWRNLLRSDPLEELRMALRWLV